jgi:hydroxypyruvate isomerase|tara:strand:- start:824 stop:1033 length:210 start_codon:yes stop_codon:yes gene_type:complete
MKPWFNTALIIMLTLVWVVIGWQLHKRLGDLEMIQSIKQVSESQLILQHDAWHQQMKKEDLVHSIDETK